MRAGVLMACRRYTVYGKRALDDADWTDITGLDSAERRAEGYRFFRLGVSLPR